MYPATEFLKLQKRWEILFLISGPGILFFNPGSAWVTALGIVVFATGVILAFRKTKVANGAAEPREKSNGWLEPISFVVHIIGECFTMMVMAVTIG